MNAVKNNAVTEKVIRTRIVHRIRGLAFGPGYTNDRFSGVGSLEPASTGGAFRTRREAEFICNREGDDCDILRCTLLP